MATAFCPACLQPQSLHPVCPNCGWCCDTSRVDPLYLSPGTIIKPPYHVARVLGHGGFGITYLGWDANLEIKVAIKEYLPRAFAIRDISSLSVLPKGEENQAWFQIGLKQFLDEARTLAKFQQHPGIVSVLAFFPAMGTGYMVMEYIDGETLKSYLQRVGRLSWAKTLEIFMHVMDALRAVHKAGLLHKDIAPDNIYLCRDGRVKLLDFGAAQTSRVETAANGQATLMIKPGFAPEEQYREDGQIGPWSDIYSVAASMYFCLTGQPPPDAQDRVRRDALRMPSAIPQVTLPAGAEHIIVQALAVNPRQRPQSMQILQQQFLNLSATPERIKTTQSRVVDFPFEALFGVLKRVTISPRMLLIAALALLMVLSLFLLNHKKNSPGQSSVTEKSVLKEEAVIEEKPDTLLEQPTSDDHAWWMEQVRREGEELKRQQAAALQRFEERRRQENAPKPQNPTQDARHLEHLRSLCDEWGATMDCKKP